MKMSNMTAELTHADDNELRSLIASDEKSAEFQHVIQHIEACESCRLRLDQLAGPSDIDDTMRELLRDYPWDSLGRSVRFQHANRESQAGSIHHMQNGDLDFLSPPSHPELLGRLGRYEIEGVIGQGGMGIVLKAHDSELNRPVAVKALAKHLSHSGAARKRFARESRAAAAVVHEHVVAIHNVEADGDTPFLVMQFVAGESLQSRVDHDGPLDTIEILRIGIQAAAGLAAAHEQGVIHRDVKPANILLENSVERALITDFGLARTVDDASLTQTGVIAGTPHYMSPEQANGQPTDHRTDLFSLGAVLYFMATGHPPFRAERAMGVLNRICHDRQKPLWQVANHIPDELSVLVDRLLEKQPAKRFVSADSLRQKLTDLLAEVQQPNHAFRRTARRWALRHPFALKANMVLIVFVLTVLVGRAWWTSTGETEPAAGLARVVDQPSDNGQRDTTASSVADAAGFTDSDTRIPDSDSLATELADLQARIQKLDATFVFDTNSESTDLQSLHQRLDRLQDSTHFELPATLENPDATEDN